MSRALSTCTTLHARRIGQVHRPAHQRHVGAGGGRRRGDGVALLAGGAVGDIAHRIDRLVRRAGGDQHALALEQLRGAVRQQAARRRRRFPAARPCGRGRARSASAISPSLGPTSATPSAASCARLRCVALFAHICGFIAGASRIFASVASSTAVARSSAWPPASLAIRSAVAGATTIEIGFARQADVADVEFMRRIEQVGEHAPAGDGAGRQRRDELLGGLGEDAAHGELAFLQPADEVERFVGGDAAADDEQHMLGRRRRGPCLRRRQGRRSGPARRGRSPRRPRAGWCAPRPRPSGRCGPRAGAAASSGAHRAAGRSARP